MKRKNKAHCVVLEGQGITVKCLHCGHTHAFGVLRVTSIPALMRFIEKEHGDCDPPPPERACSQCDEAKQEKR